MVPDTTCSLILWLPPIHFWVLRNRATSLITLGIGHLWVQMVVLVPQLGWCQGGGEKVDGPPAA